MRRSTVKIAEFRRDLSKYLKRVRKGDEVIIADREVPIGKLIPFKGKENEEEPFEPVSPRRGFASFAKLKFPSLEKDFDVVEMLLEDRRKR